MRKLYNVDLPVPANIQAHTYKTHIIYAPGSIDTDSQSSETEMQSTGEAAPSPNPPIATSLSHTSLFFKNIKSQLSLSTVSKSTVKAYNYLIMNSLRDSPKSSKSSSSVSLSSLSNITSSRLVSSPTPSSRPRVANEPAPNGVNNFIDSSQIERYSTLAKK
jgi:hypothetical protein